ncbi:MAG: class I SAM-dependent methyltransferase [Acidobacteria bacterium]|nr:class I SAM-dependent methyltransferase [Acidobacteriota bacterium]
MSHQRECRLCGADLEHVFVDLGMSPLCESYVPAEKADAMEPFYPLCVYVCGECLLVQLPPHVSGEHIFSEYAYFSSYSDSWLDHARRYCEAMTQRFGIDQSKHVVEVASNDGYLLRNFVAAGVPCTGIEPATNVAQAAIEKGVPTINRFFGQETARDLKAQGLRADLLTANNVLAHVPDLHDFVGGIGILLAPDGVFTGEIPHVLRLIEQNQFDTIYQEHYSYLSVAVLERLFGEHGMELFDVEELPTHGGSIRVYAQATGGPQARSPRLDAVLEAERRAGLHSIEGYLGFDRKAQECRYGLLEFLIEARRNGKKVAGYGAPGKGNTLLNYCSIRADLLPYTVDRNPYKQGKLLPGSRIPIKEPEEIFRDRPDYVLILPWNLKDEIAKQLEEIKSWDGQFVTPIPSVAVF